MVGTMRRVTQPFVPRGPSGCQAALRTGAAARSGLGVELAVAVEVRLGDQLEVADDLARLAGEQVVHHRVEDRSGVAQARAVPAEGAVVVVLPAVEGGI